MCSSDLPSARPVNCVYSANLRTRVMAVSIKVGTIQSHKYECQSPRNVASEPRDFSRLAAWLVPRKGRVHLTIFVLTLLMVPGVLTALEPIDVESYEMDSPEIEAQQVIDDEFSSSEDRKTSCRERV